MSRDGRWSPPRAALLHVDAPRPPAPASIRWAVGLLVLHAIVTGGPIGQAFVYAQGTRSIGWQVAFMGADLLLMTLELGIAALPLWRRRWPRVVMAVLFVLLLGDYVAIGDMGRRFASYPWAATRDVVDWAVQAVALMLLFLPASSRWYRRTAT